MTSREYVKAAIEHRETDRVPYFILTTGETNDQIKAELGVDNVGAWLDNDVQSIGVPWWHWHRLGADWRGGATPTSPSTVRGSGNYDNLEDSVKAMRDRSDKYFLVTIWGSHFEKANSARGIENFLADIAADYDFAKKLCTKIVDRNMVMLENFLSIEEIDGVLLGSDWGSQRGLLMSPEIWEDMICPGEKREYELVHSYGKDVWLHSCGCIDVLIPRLVEIGVDVLNPVQPECMDIEAMKADYGDRLTFWGGISTQKTLPFGSAEEVREESRWIRDMMSENGGYIFSPAQALQGDVPVANIQAMLEIAREKRGEQSRT
jgi:uroporphyrinogen decarboxylase